MTKKRYHKFTPLKTTCRAIKSTILCLRFPFLYPHNRFTDKHYNNWKLDKKIDRYFNESHKRINPVDISKLKAGTWTDDDTWNNQHPKYCVINVWKAVWCSLLKSYRVLLRITHCIPTYTELDSMEPGWRNAFGIEMCNRLKKALKKDGKLRTYRIEDIKEKWGELCWYSGGGNEETFRIEREYEDRSAKLCITCGRPAKWLTRGWICPYCSEHLPKNALESGRYESIETNKWEVVFPPEHP